MAMAITGATVVAPAAAVALRDVSKLSMSSSSSSSSSGTASFFSSFCTQGTTPPHVMIRASGIRSKVTRVVAVRPAASHEADPGAEEQRSARREVLAGLLAVGAALAASTTTREAYAISGPGGDGAKETADKALDLLKAGDDLNVNEAPSRVGPGRIEDAAKSAKSVAQQAGAGSGANPSGIADDAVTKAREKLNEGKARFGDLFKGKVGSASDISDKASNLAGDAQNLANKAVSGAQNKVRF
ncbi:hypothetical protein CY35_05G037300 [Sphagnum magellanicum]|jgi:hypothetical protein|nr:hypothetical protein CY35_05G037300 [Sphagnum magellanicum]